ncbi:MAG: hypothetical protein AAGG57_20190 [Pseudomonadota bacterium]
MYQERTRTVFVGIASSLILSACASVNPAGLIAASRLDPVNTAPAEIAVALGVPETVRLRDGDAVFRIVFESEDPDARSLVDETVPLLVREIDDSGPLPSAAGEIVYTARFAPEDAVRIAEAQAKIRAFRAQGIEGQGTLGVMVDGGCVAGPALDALPVSTWLQTNPEAGFVSLTRRQDVFKALDERNAKALRAQLAPCDDQGG